LKTDPRISPDCRRYNAILSDSGTRRSKKRDEDKESGPESSHYLRRYSTAATSSMRGWRCTLYNDIEITAVLLRKPASINEFSVFPLGTAAHFFVEKAL